MNVQMTLTVDPTSKVTPSVLRTLADSMEASFDAARTQVTDVSTPAKTGKTAKPAKTAKEEETDEADDTFELNADDGAESEETETEEAEEEEADEEETTLDDVTKAFQKYAKKHSREKAAKVLAKFKAKSVRDLKPAQYGKVLEVLGV